MSHNQVGDFGNQNTYIKTGFLTNVPKDKKWLRWNNAKEPTRNTNNRIRAEKNKYIGKAPQNFPMGPRPSYGVFARTF